MAVLNISTDVSARNTVRQALRETVGTYDDRAALVAETQTIPEGTAIETIAEGFRFEVAASGATDHHVTTAGGVKLYVTPVNGRLSVLAFGASGDGVTNDAPAFQAALDAAAALVDAGDVWPEVMIPSGNYLLQSTVNVAANIALRGGGSPRVIIGHTGSGIVLSGVPAVGTFPRGKVVIDGIYFTTDGSEPLCIIQNGLPDGLVTDPTYLYSQNNTEISRCVFDQFTGDHAVLNYRGFNINFNACLFNSLTVNESAVEMKQSNGDTPYWSFAFNFFSCDFTGIAGNGIAIRADSGDVIVHGGVIEGCSGNAVVLAASASYTGVAHAAFFGVYFEYNDGDHVHVANLSATIGFHSCKFVSGGLPNSFYFSSGTKAAFHSCSTPNNGCAFDGGTIDLYHCSYIYGSKTALTALHVHDHSYVTSSPTVPNAMSQQIRANAINSVSAPGGHLVMCTHYESASGINATVTELFLVRTGVALNQIEAISLARSTGSAGTATFAFSVDVDGFVQVAADKAGNASYQVLSHFDGIFGET